MDRRVGVMLSSPAFVIGAVLLVAGYGIALAVLGGFSPRRLARVRAHIRALGDTPAERAAQLESILDEAQRKRIAECNARARRGMQRGYR